MITERLNNIPITLIAAKKDRRNTRMYLLSLRFLAHRLVTKIATGPEKIMKDNKMTARRARDFTAATSLVR